MLIPEAYSPSVCSMFWFEVGGAVGSPLSGLLSDRLFNGRRGPINLLFALSVAPALVVLYLKHESTALPDKFFSATLGSSLANFIHHLLILLWGSCLWYDHMSTLYHESLAHTLKSSGPQMLLGVHLAELVDRRIASTVQGLSGLVAGIGASAAG